jgi:hypothetical protein
LSVTDPIVPFEIPPVLKNVTVKAPEVRALFAASRVVRVRVLVAPAKIEPELTVTVEFARENGPGFTVTVGKVELTGVPSINAVIVVAVPEVVPVKIAV